MADAKHSAPIEAQTESTRPSCRLLEPPLRSSPGYSLTPPPAELWGRPRDERR